MKRFWLQSAMLRLMAKLPTLEATIGDVAFSGAGDQRHANQSSLCEASQCKDLSQPVELDHGLYPVAAPGVAPCASFQPSNDSIPRGSDRRRLRGREPVAD